MKVNIRAIAKKKKKKVVKTHTQPILKAQTQIIVFSFSQCIILTEQEQLLPPCTRKNFHNRQTTNKTYHPGNTQQLIIRLINFIFFSVYGVGWNLINAIPTNQRHCFPACNKFSLPS